MEHVLVKAHGAARGAGLLQKRKWKVEVVGFVDVEKL